LFALFCIGLVVLGFILCLVGKAEIEARAKKEQQEQERRWHSPEEVAERKREAEEQQRKDEEERLAREKRWREHQRREELERREQISRKERIAREEKWEAYHMFVGIEETDGMSGVEFEQFYREILERTGYTQIRGTPASGDQGCDLQCVSPDGKKTVVQVKRWQGPVGNTAVQEILGALLFYDADIGFVVTNSSL